MLENLVLASNSPRRMELLRTCQINFEITNHSFDEDAVTEKNTTKFAKILAYGKAASVANQKEYSNKFVLGVDTIVVYKNKILGKPKDSIEAEKNIRMLSGKTHKVISGIALVNNQKNISLVTHQTSYVTFEKINEEFIKFYLDNIHWKGYAGGYAIQGIFSLVVKKIKGSYTNIVGLPMEKLYEMITELKRT
ncbi:MAG: septum formation protein Maf [Spirochaetes bacterium GWD1_27_9]|nr:MAG: septum formation protein Maf [Spirochaetes bacterium GWB1_27_13]OHD22104.1 MAG: septum formation protein Maf [Spirochaetes bacterium GWC1_27_15]OHD28949.1 MAG: septum formation protein Maf [Spirochaetes bacterium GWD1_27_9]